MPALSEYNNVYNTALLLLQEKGYQWWYDSNAEAFCAERDGWDFMAPSPCGLLGLVAIYEATAPLQYSEYWWRKDGPAVFGPPDRMPDSPGKSYRSVVRGG